MGLQIAVQSEIVRVTKTLKDQYALLRKRYMYVCTHSGQDGF